MKSNFSRVDLAEIGMAYFSPSSNGRRIVPLHFSHRVDRKTYMDRLVWSLNELTMIFGRFAVVDPLKLARLVLTGQSISKTSFDAF
jgi:hypothetical protein